MKNTTAFNELSQFEPNIPPGLGRTIGKQAAFQASGLLLSIAIAFIGGLITGEIYHTALCCILEFHVHNEVLFKHIFN